MTDQNNKNAECEGEGVQPLRCMGMPVLLDAAQFRAYAYRLRNWWCNWLDPVELEAVAAGVRRAPHRYVVDILDSHHEMTGVIRTNGPPFYPVNRGGGGGLPAHPGFLPRLQSLQDR